MIQFFVDKGNGSEVVRCCSHALVSQVLGYGSEGYAVCGTRILRPSDSFQQNGIESGMTVRHVAMYHQHGVLDLDQGHKQYHLVSWRM